MLDNFHKTVVDQVVEMNIKELGRHPLAARVTTMTGDDISKILVRKKYAKEIDF